MAFDIQDAIRRARAAGISDSEIEHFFELTAGERERIEAGDLSAWVAKDSPDYRRRLGARARTMGQAKTRQMQEAQDQAERLGRLQALLERPGITEDMTIEDAIAAGIVTEEEVDQPFAPFDPSAPLSMDSDPSAGKTGHDVAQEVILRRRVEAVMRDVLAEEPGLSPEELDDRAIKRIQADPVASQEILEAYISLEITQVLRDQGYEPEDENRGDRWRQKNT